MRIKSEVSFWTMILGGLTSSIPLINLIRNFAKISLIDRFQNLLTDYKRIINAIADKILFWTDYKPSQEYLDGVTLSIIASLIFLRSGYTLALKNPDSEYATGIETLIIGGIMLFAMSLALLPLIYYPLSLVLIIKYLINRKSQPEKESTIFGKFVLISIMSTIIAIGTFFFTNYLLK
ncbi:hypothetical protein V5097_04295 [Arenibacter palladensis]|uniref:hypothetical protein n=1 Tax=Arenibacter palladensis TaxID=237373 RepID=UPI002FD5B482